MNLLLLSLTSLCAGISLSLLAPFYPNEALAKGVSVTQSGIVTGSAFVTTILCTPLFGKYIETFGARWFLIVGTYIIGLGNIGFGFLDILIDSGWFFALSIVLRVFIAVGECALIPSTFPIAQRQVSAKHHGTVIGIVEASFGVGTMFGPSMGGFLYDSGGFSLPFGCWVALHL